MYFDVAGSFELTRHGKKLVTEASLGDLKQKSLAITWFLVPETYRGLAACRQFLVSRIVRFYILVENFDELGNNVIALQGSEKAAVHVDRGFRLFECSRQRNS